MNNKAMLFLGFLLAAVGIYFFTVNQKRIANPDRTLISQNLEGNETPTPAPGARSALLSPAAPLRTPSVSDREKLNLLKEILASRNDNDPRMDSELKHLSPEVKKEMEAYYRQLPLEKLNDRGTIAFLIGRSVSRVEDVEFLKSVMMEKACLSLNHCSKAPSPKSAEEVHQMEMNQTTLNYPQLMALEQVLMVYTQLKVDDSASPELMKSIEETLRQTSHSPNPRISAESQKALKTIGSLQKHSG